MNNNETQFIDTSKEVKNAMVKLAKDALKASGKAVNQILKESTPARTGGLKKSIKAWAKLDRNTGQPYMEIGYLSKAQMKKRGIIFFVNPYWFEYGTKPHLIMTKQYKEGGNRLTYELSRGSQKFGVIVRHPGMKNRQLLRTTVMNNIDLIQKAQQEKLSQLTEIMISQGANFDIGEDEEID